MLTSLIVQIVDASRRFALPVIVLTLVASVALGGYVATHFRINTDINQLLSADLAWRQREMALEQAFPQKTDRLVVVIDGDTPDAAEDAAAALAQKMQALPQHFKNVIRPEAIPFFRKNGLLFLSADELNGLLDKLAQAQPMLGTIASDPSLRGLFGTLDLVLQGVAQEQVDAKMIAPAFAMLGQAVEGALAGQEKPIPWRGLMLGKEPQLRDLRKFILTQPVLDYAALSPGEAASQTVRMLAQDLRLTPEHGVRVRLTGSVALNDEEFASVAEGTKLATLLSVTLVLFILFLALRSFRLIVPILLTLAVGLVATTAFAMAAIGSLNLISVAFAVMFVGIAVDFGIQFGVRYRDQHHLEPDSGKAMLATARIIARPLTLAAGSTALGFLAFIPTAYRGVAELGMIAGFGMIVAFLLNITLLPALLALFKPPAESEAVGFRWAAPLDGFIVTHRKPVLVLTALLALAGLVGATQLRFDFDPLNLKDPRSESVSTLFDLMIDPQATPYTVELLAPTQAEAEDAAKRLAALPEVSHAMTLASFVPEEQDKKLAMIEDANFLLAPTLNPDATLAPPSPDEVFAAIGKTATHLQALAAAHPEAGALAKALEAVAQSRDPATLDRLHNVLVRGLTTQLTMVRDSLTASQVTPDNISDDLQRDWITPDGRAKVEVYPKGDARDYRVLTAFTKAVREAAPEASGAPISIEESGNTVTSAFVQAGLAALLAIAALVWLVLRRFGDVLRLLAPLVLAGILTLATMALLPLPLDFANIIALPLLLSLGVSYAIYFVSYWRDGQANPLQSSMARAVLFSAFTTLVAFGSLSLSTHPGTSGMGELLTLALLYSLLCTFVVLPALLGRPKVG